MQPSKSVAGVGGGGKGGADSVIRDLDPDARTFATGPRTDWRRCSQGDPDVRGLGVLAHIRQRLLHGAQNGHLVFSRELLGSDLKLNHHTRLTLE